MATRGLALCILVGALLALPPGATASGSLPASTSFRGTWTNVTAPPSPQPMAGAMMAYSPHANRFVLFGGWNGSGLNDTWTYDPLNRSWALVPTTLAPATRGDASFAYDSRDDLFVLFGGWHELANETYLRLGDTWTFSLASGTWSQRHPALSPSARSDAAIAYDAKDDFVFLFGGFTGTTYLGDGWAYHAATDTWSTVASGPSPSPRADGRIAYDPMLDAFYLFGGNDYSGPNLTFHHLADTWVFSGDTGTWSQIPTTSAPGARDYAVLAYSPDADALLLVGGYGDRTILGDTWAFDLRANAWAPLDPVVSPPPRFAGVGGYDTQDGFLVLVGGLGVQGLLADTWTLRVAAVAGPAAPASAFPGTWLVAGALGLGFAGLLAAGVWARRQGPVQELLPERPGEERGH